MPRSCNTHLPSVLAADETRVSSKRPRGRLTDREWSEWGSRGVWQIRSVRRNDRHEAEFPEELAARVIRLYSPEWGTVIDPFVGSGTTTAIAKLLNRHWLGIESQPNYARIARMRSDEAR